MQKKELYRYEELDGSVTVTPNKRNDTDVVYKYRLVADENAILVNGDNQTQVVDVAINEVDLWVEESTEATVEDYQNALSELGVI